MKKYAKKKINHNIRMYILRNDDICIQNYSRWTVENNFTVHLHRNPGLSNNNILYVYQSKTKSL